jgi:hypothetical protein
MLFHCQWDAVQLHRGIWRTQSRSKEPDHQKMEMIELCLKMMLVSAGGIP